MFDVYIQEQAIDPRLRNRMMGAMTTALTVTVCAGLLVWGADKLNVSSVSAPQQHDILMLSMAPEPPPTPPPPNRPQTEQAQASSGPAAKEEKARPPKAQDFLETESRPRNVSADAPADGPGGDGSDDGPRIPGRRGSKTPCLIGMACDTVIKPPDDDDDDDDAATPEVVKVDIKKMRSMFTPNPKKEELRKTKTGMGTQRTGSVRVAFCTDAGGKVVSANIKKRFPGDPGIDAIARATVKRWRFHPMRVLGKARRTCSEVSFQIRFD